MQAGQEISDSFAGSWFTMERSGYLDEVAIWAAVGNVGLAVGGEINQVQHICF